MRRTSQVAGKVHRSVRPKGSDLATAFPAGKELVPVGCVLDQKGCRFQPQVIAMLPGDIDIGNSDGILHRGHSGEFRPHLGRD